MRAIENKKKHTGNSKLSMDCDWSWDFIVPLHKLNRIKYNDCYRIFKKWFGKIGNKSILQSKFIV